MLERLPPEVPNLPPDMFNAAALFAMALCLFAGFVVAVAYLATRRPSEADWVQRIWYFVVMLSIPALAFFTFIGIMLGITALSAEG